VKGKYPNVVGLHFVSPVTGKNMDQLTSAIQDVVAKQVLFHSVFSSFHSFGLFVIA
jgi:hypothetical protein